MEIPFSWLLFTQVHIDSDYVSHFIIQGKENKDIRNVVLFNNITYI